jgi:hypothetical protein
MGQSSTFQASNWYSTPISTIPMENVIYVHPETVMPFCAKDIEIFNDQNELIGSIKENHQTKRTINVAQSAPTRYLKIKVTNSNPNVPASLFEIRAYA